MALETGTYISDLVSTNPVSTDGVTQADDHLRLIKSTVKATFPNISGAVTSTHTELNLLDGVTATTAELNYVDGVTSNIQTQLDAKQPLDAGLTAYAALATAANKGLYFTGSDTPATYDLSAFARTLLDDADAAASRTTLLAAGTGVSNTFTASQIVEVTDNTNAALRVTQLGTGLALRIEDSANPDSTPTVVDASGNVGVGTASPQTYLHLSSSSDGEFFRAQRIGGSNIPIIRFNLTESTNIAEIEHTGAAAGTLSLKTNGNSRLTVDSSGNVLNISSGGLGYGTGSGGTVTQLTSKSTGVTLNKTNGQIISHNAALAATSEVAFTVTNSTVAATDVIILSKASGGASAKYDLYVGAVAAGSFDVVIRNVTSASGSDAITINFAVIKAVNS